MNNARRKMLKQAVDLIVEAREIIEETKAEEEEAYENYPSRLQMSENGQKMNDCIFNMEDLIGSLEEIEASIEEMAG